MINMVRSTKKKLVFSSMILTDDKCKNNEHLTNQLKKIIKKLCKNIKMSPDEQMILLIIYLFSQ